MGLGSLGYSAFEVESIGVNVTSWLGWKAGVGGSVSIGKSAHCSGEGYDANITGFCLIEGLTEVDCFGHTRS